MSSRNGIRDSLLVFSLRLLLVAFSLNWVWEMAQGSAYVELAAMPPLQRLWRCTIASVGDAFFTRSASMVWAAWERGGFAGFCRRPGMHTSAWRSLVLHARQQMNGEHSHSACGHITSECPSFQPSRSDCGPFCNSRSWFP